MGVRFIFILHYWKEIVLAGKVESTIQENKPGMVNSEIIQSDF